MAAAPKKAATLVREVEGELADTTADRGTSREARGRIVCRRHQCARRNRTHGVPPAEGRRAPAGTPALLATTGRRRTRPPKLPSVGRHCATASPRSWRRPIRRGRIAGDRRARGRRSFARSSTSGKPPGPRGRFQTRTIMLPPVRLRARHCRACAVKALFVVRVLSGQCRSVPGRRPGERRQQSLPGAQSQSRPATHPSAIKPFADALKQAIGFAVDAMGTKLDPLRAVNVGEAVASVDGERTPAEQHWRHCSSNRPRPPLTLRPKARRVYMADRRRARETVE